MNKKKRLLALLLAVSLAIPNVSYVSADDATPSDAEAVSEQETSEIPDTEYVVVDNEGNVVEEDTSEEGSDKMEEEPPEVTDKVTEQVTEEVTTEIAVVNEATSEEKQPTFTAPVEGVDVSGIDFSSKQLLVGTEDENIFTWDTTVVSGYNGIYLTEYASEEETKNAYTYYYGKADFVDANITFSVSDNEGSEDEPRETADLSEINTGDDAISNLVDMDTTGTVPAGTIAVIDTGINAEGLVDSVSVIGDSVLDDNGHGTRMYDYIKDEYPDAKILSIKALGADGKGQVSDVYAAIQYAIEKRVSVINLSISAYSTAESDVIRTVIEEAVAQGIVVVGAAGNDGKNVRYFIPGNIETAIIVGSCDSEGAMLPKSNFGDTVDYYVVSDSTSEASARYSGIIASGKDTDKVFVMPVIKVTESTDKPSGSLTYEEYLTELSKEIDFDDPAFMIADFGFSNNGNVKTWTTAQDFESYAGTHYGTASFTKTDSGEGTVTFGTDSPIYKTTGQQTFNAECEGHGSGGGETGSACARTMSSGNVSYKATATVTTSGTTKTINWEVWLTNGDSYEVNWTYKEATLSGPYIWSLRSEYISEDLQDRINEEIWHGMYSGCMNPTYIYSTNTLTGTPNPGGYATFRVTNIHYSYYEADKEQTFRLTMSAKSPIAQPYYIGIKKVDMNGKAMSGVTFTVKYHNNDTNTDVTIPGGYINSKYSGIWTGYRIDYKDTYGTSYRNTAYDGVGVFYLGDFANAPTNIKVTENWHGRSDTGSGWDGERAEVIESTATNPYTTRNVYAKEYVQLTDDFSVTAYGTEALAKTNAASFEYTNWEYANVTLEKKSNTTLTEGNADYSFDGIVYGLYGDSACTELIATVTLRNIDNNHTKGVVKNAADVSIKKTKTNNNSEPYVESMTVSGSTRYGVGGLMYGTYYWKEVSVPSGCGYALDNSAHATTVNRDHADVFKIETVTDSPVPKDYYIAIKKDDDEGHAMRGVSFNLSFKDNDANATRSMTAAYTFTAGGVSRTYNGIWSGYSGYVTQSAGTYFIVQETEETGSNRGVSVIKLGSFYTKPTNITVTENWVTATGGWASGGKVAIYDAGGTNERFMYKSDFKTSNQSKSVTAYTSRATALQNYGSFTFTNTPRRFYVGIYKSDKDGKAVKATFDIYGTNTSGATTGGTKLWTISTTSTNARVSKEVTEKYNTTSTNISGKYKYFYAVETSNDTGYKLPTYPDNTKVLTVHEDSLATSDYITWKNNIEVFAYLNKQSSNPDCTDGNPNYDLKGAEYKVFTTRAAAQNALNSNSYTNAIATLTVQNNTDGKTNTVNMSDYMTTDPVTGLFVSKTFYVVESKAGKNYLRSTSVYTLTVTPSNDSSNPAHISVTDEPVNDPFNIEIIKTDKLTGSNEVPEGKTLAGAQFRIDFYAVDITQTYTQTQLETNFADKKVASETRIITVQKDDVTGQYYADLGVTFPLGYITVTEITPPADYSLNGAKVYLQNDKTKDITGNLAFVLSVNITDNGTDYSAVTYHPLYPNINLAGSTGAAFNITDENTPIRGNLRLTKLRYADGTPIKGVEFEIKNNATGEKHSIYTDANGNATTVGNSDAWFSLLDNGKTIAYNADYGCLPTGTYTVTEKRCEVNEGLQLLKPATVTINSTATVLVAEADGKLYNIEMPEITTTARVVDTDSKTLAQMGEPQTIEDVVAYKNLRADTTYTLVGRLMVRHPDGTYEAYKKNGTAYTVKKTFTTGATWTKSEFEKSGTVTVNYEGIYAENYEGCSFVVFEKLYLGTNTTTASQYPEYAGSEETIFPVVHENINDEGQTVRPVDIHTTIADSVTDDHIAKTGKVTVTDRVYYTGLTVNEYYTIKGTLHVTGYSWKDADGNLIKTTTVDGEELLDADGNPVTAEKTFQAKSTDGYEDLEFTFDASLLEGESVVAFESLIYKDREIAVHADLSDEDETVHFPMIHTTLYREGTGEWAEDYDETDPTKVTTVDEASKEVMAAEEAVVVDRIKYHNLIAGRSYVVKGILIDKATGEPLLDANGDKIEVEQKFTLDEVPEENITASPDTGDYVLADGTILDMSADHSIQLVDGYFEVTFPAFDASEMGNKKAVAYEEVYLLTTDANGDETEHLVAEHKDKDDVDQTVRFVEIHTNANVEETDSRLVPIEGPVTINDTVTYKNLIPGKEYTLTARPVVKGDKTGTYKDGDPLLDVNGKEVTATITFIPDEPDGEVVVPITFEGYLIPETSIVCYEDMTNDKGLEIAVHNDINDEDQTTYVVDISTTARGNSSADNEEFATEETIIIDTVSYSGLEVGREYRVSGIIMDKETGKELLGADGKPVTAETTFKAEAEDGTIDITFPAFDGTTLAGKDIVVFEKLYIIVVTVDAEGKESSEEYLIAEHEDLDDEGQTVHLPEIKTSAVDKATGDSVARVSEEVTIVDTVSYTNLTVGNTYTVKGVLMVKETGKELLDADGKPVTVETTFKAEKPDGTVDVVFTFDSSLLEGETLVVFEDLYREDIHVATHSDIEDEDQTIRFPKVKTKAEDAVTKENIGEAGKETTIIDTVYYWNLIVGKKYTVKGVLMNQATGEELLDADGNPVTAEKTFTAETTEGTVELTFTFDGSLLAGETVIVFEDLYHNDIRVAGHTDITDEDQSEHHPGIKTRATDRNTGEQVGYADKTVTIVDEVSYTNLIVGKKYTVKGTLMDRDTGAVFLVDGKPVTAEKTFTAEKPDGVVELEFTFDGSALRGTVIVVFEDLFYKSKRVATHADLTDKDQTVYYPAVQTHVEDQTKRVQPVENVTVVDDVMYSKLKVGESYQLVGVLVDKKTGKNIVVDNTPIKATKVFTAEAEDGMITMEFHFDATGLDGDVTVFEYLSLVKDVDNKDLNYYLVAEHTDLNDTEQTFVISPVPKTGDDTPVNILFGLLLLSGLGLAFLFWKKRTFSH